MKSSLIFILILISFPVLTIESLAQEKSNNVFITGANTNTLPVPKEKNQLFYLQRDPNTNTIIYSLNLEDGQIVKNNPVNIHWIRYAEGGQRSDLSFVQRKMAYGVHHTRVSDKEYDIRIQAYKDLPIRVKYNKEQEKYQAFTEIENKEVILERIFVRITGGSIFNPNVKYIEVCGYDPISDSKINHRFFPQQ